jgi:Kef-type K+ transport system membrane component KefB
MSIFPRNLLSLTDGENPLEDPLALFIVQLVFILVVSRILGYFLKYLKQPQVIAEVITGIILGPTLLGLIPGYLHHLFSGDSLKIVKIFANIGLIFFMFLIGIELDPGLLKRNAKHASIIAFSSMALPFGIGALVSILLYDMYADHATKFSTFLLFVGVAMSITAFPVLARILTETRLTGAKVGLISLSAAAVNDVVAWILLAVVVSIAKATSPLSTLWTLLIMVGFFAFMAFVIRPLLVKLNNMAQTSAAMRHQMVLVTFTLILVCSWFTEVIGIHAIFGGFVMGVVSPREHGWAIYITERIEDMVVILLLPLYFVVSGLATNLRNLTDGQSWGMCFLVIVLACFGKIVGSMVPAKILGNTWRESVTVGILMNTKGLVELIVLNLGLEVGVLTQELFAIFVMMAVVTTMFTSPLLHFIWIRNQKKREVQPLIHDNFSVMMCISNQVTGLAMVSIAATLAVQKKKKFSLQALHITEVTDNPSSYFFAHRKPPPSFLDLVKERSRAHNIPLKVKQFLAVNVADDLDHYCRSKGFDLLLIAWNEPIIERGGSKIKQVLSHTPSTVGVLVNRGIEQIFQITKVLAVYGGQAHQKDALKIARLMCRKMGVLVTLISNIPASELGIEQEPINFMFSENPLSTAVDESMEKYDLVIVGIAREWSAHDSDISRVSDLLNVTTASVLLVHPKMEGMAHKSKKKRSSELSEEKSLFWGDPKMRRNKSRDFGHDLESGSGHSEDILLRKSKSKLRVDTYPDVHMSDLHLEEGVPKYKEEDNYNNAESHKRSGDTPDYKKEDRSHIDAGAEPHTSSELRMRQRMSTDSLHTAVDIPIIPPPPQPTTPRTPSILPPSPMRSPQEAANHGHPAHGPTQQQQNDDFVYVD